MIVWKDGDWCFFEFKLCQIFIKYGKVQDASDGMFRTGGYDLSDRCRPLTLHNAYLSQVADHWSDKLHRDGNAGLNFPDIHRKLVDLWVIACDAAENDKKAIDAIGNFAQAVLDAQKNFGSVDGVRLLRTKFG